MKLLGLVLFSLAAVASVSGCRHSRTVIGREPTNAEYQVLSSYLNERFKRDAEHNKLNLVIVSETLTARDNTQATTEMYKLIPTLGTTHRTAFRSFLETNHYSSKFQSSFVLSVPYQVVKSSELESMFKSDWSGYYEKYPHSNLLDLSRVGFNDDGTEAAFYTSVRCGGLCGSGYFVIMQRRSNSEWVIVQEARLWVS